MLTYEVQYKCDLSELYPNLPCIRYKYRRSKRVFWEKKGWVYFDQFALRHHGQYYYGANDISDIETYTRLRIMRAILDKEYNGNLRGYVEAMVEFEIKNDLIDKEEDRDAREISLSFVTDGWKSTTVKITEGAEKTGA